MKNYEPVEMEVIEFTSEDVITTSNTSGGDVSGKMTNRWYDEEEEE